MALLRPDEVEAAVSLQQRSYALLRWAGSNMDGQQFDEVHAAGEDLRSARGWLERNWSRLPLDCRPGEREFEAFANFFSTYLLTSFDLIEEPGSRGESVSGTSCNCELCMYLARAPHLKAKRIQRGDRQRAQGLMAKRLRQLGVDLGVPLAPGEDDELLKDPELEEDAALSTYGVQLLERCEGRGAGPEILALWRRFAWNQQGSPKQGFQLTAELVLDAEAQLVERLRQDSLGESGGRLDRSGR